MKSAFLNGELSEEFYVQLSEGFIIAGDEEKVCKLKRTLYGLKQAPRAWYKRIDWYFLEYGFKGNENEPTVYKKEQSNE